MSPGATCSIGIRRPSAIVTSVPYRRQFPDPLEPEPPPPDEPPLPPEVPPPPDDPPPPDEPPELLPLPDDTDEPLPPEELAPDDPSVDWLLEAEADELAELRPEEPLELPGGCWVVAQTGI